MFRFRVTNLGTADQHGNRSLLEFSYQNEPMCTAVWELYHALECGTQTDGASFVCNVFNRMLDLVVVDGGAEALKASTVRKTIRLQQDSKGIVSPDQLPYPVTFCEKVDSANIADEFMSIVLHTHQVDALVAWMNVQHEYKKNELQLLKMHCIINCAMILDREEAVRLLLMGNPLGTQVPYLYEFENEDAVFVQEWKDTLLPLTNGGSSEHFSENAKIITNDLDINNVTACIATGNVVDITKETTTAMKQNVSTWDLQCKPFRFTATYHPGSRQSNRPSVVVVNWHAKFVKGGAYEDMFVDVCALFYDAVDTALESRNIVDQVCTLVVADSNLQDEESGRRAAQLCAKRNMALFNHTEKVNAKAIDEQQKDVQHNVLVNNVNRGRRYSNMSAQWKKAHPDAPATSAPKGVVVSLANSQFIVRAHCKQRDTPSVGYKLDHGHFTVTVEHKAAPPNAWVFFFFLLFIGVALGFLIQ